MTFEMALKIVRSETPVQTAERLVELYNTIHELGDSAKRLQIIVNELQKTFE